MKGERYYNFTLCRLRSRDPLHGRSIVICGKCGRKGRDNGAHTAKDGTVFHSVTHSGTVRNIVGLPMFEVDDWCGWRVAPELKAGA